MKNKMINQEMVFVEDNFTSFEDFAKQNGITYWLASDLSQMLGYNNTRGIRKALNKANTICISLNIPVIEHFIQITDDLKLTRFACYLIVMNGDIKNKKVAKAQAFLSKIAVIAEQEYIQRFYERSELKEQEKSISHTAHLHGVKNYAFFQNKGYIGMYNMSLKELKKHKGLDNEKHSLLDYMGSVELAGNSFRLTMTELKIKRDDIQGQNNLEKTAREVGESVRQTIIKTVGIKPEDLAIEEARINKIESGLRKTQKTMLNHDNKNKA